MSAYRWTFSLVLTMSLLLKLLSAIAHAESSPEQNVWVAAISVEAYDHLNSDHQLRYCNDDAQHVMDRLTQHNSIPHSQTLHLRQDDFYPPTQNNILNQLPSFVAEADEDDVLVLYFSMHGMCVDAKDGSGRSQVYLVPSDGNPANPHETMISMDWLRHLLQSQVRARRVVLLLDACHSGGIQASVPENHYRHFTTRSFETALKSDQMWRQDQCIYVLTSCKGNESSLEMGSVKHGLFTYWLLAGMDGAADANGDATITMDELYQFVSREVPRTARATTKNVDSSFAQTPQRFFCGKQQGDLPLLSLKPEKLSMATQRLSRLVDALLRQNLTVLGQENKTSRVGIMEFASVGAQGNAELRGDLGSFGSLSRTLIERGLIDQSVQSDGHLGSSYRVVNSERWLKVLKSFELQEIQRGDVSIPIDAGGELDAVVYGIYTRRGRPGSTTDPERLDLELQLLDLKEGYKMGRLSTTILIEPELLSLLGTSSDRTQWETSTASPSQPVDPTPSQRPNAPNPQLVDLELYQPISDSLVAPAFESFTALQQTSHPLREPESTALKLSVFQRERGRRAFSTPWLPPQPSHPNQLAFATREGRELILRVRNQTDQWLAVIVQIDGRSQIGGEVELPSKAAYWLFPPGEEVDIDQWIDKPSAEAKPGESKRQTLQGNKLLVQKAPESVNQQVDLASSLGEIRVLVYETVMTKPGSKSRDDRSSGMMIGRGAETQKTYARYDDRAIDRKQPVATYVLHYHAEP
jgi:hypothetical protein